ncbi:hypothetical protein B0H17DRAFT_1149324 [Mycena rosella]|uniref:Uncharacterized protein n=1 Tax=Mycena rosella TaxID=1033263 RepID=A0AAD7C354_MYCRO|nr:hypothetical protein B0H17DRAFT_1149324 [Mycena rosella]
MSFRMMCKYLVRLQPAVHEAWCPWNTSPLDSDGILQGVANNLVLTMSQFTLSRMEWTEISLLLAAATDYRYSSGHNSTAMVMKDSFTRAHCNLVKSAPNRAVGSMPICRINQAKLPTNMTNQQCSRRRWLLLDVVFFRKGVGTGGGDFGY